MVQLQLRVGPCVVEMYALLLACAAIGGADVLSDSMTVAVETTRVLNRLPNTFVSFGWEMDQMRRQVGEIRTRTRRWNTRTRRWKSGSCDTLPLNGNAFATESWEWMIAESLC